MKPESSTPCSNEQELSRTRTTRHAIKRPNVGLKCSSCQRRFPSAVRLRRHLSVVHKNSGKIFCCNKCNIFFDDLSVFLRHSKEHRSSENRQQHEDKLHEPYSEDSPLEETYKDSIDTNGHSSVFEENETVEDRELTQAGTAVFGATDLCQGDPTVQTDLTEAADGNNSAPLLVQESEIPVTGRQITAKSFEKSNLEYSNHERFSDHPTMATLSTQINNASVLPFSRTVSKAPLAPRYKSTRKNVSVKKKQGAASNGNRVKYLTAKNAKQLSQSSFQSPHFDPKSDNLNIGLPCSVKTINLLSNPTIESERTEVISYLNTVNRKLDAIIRHFNVPCAEQVDESSSQSSVNNVLNEEIETSSEVPMSFWTDNPQTPSMVSRPALGRKDDGQKQNLSPRISFDDITETKPYRTQPLHTHTSISNLESPIPTLPINFSTSSMKIPDSIIERMRSRSLNRGNFAKHLVFHLFSPEERTGKNCFGRRASVRSGPKAALDPAKLLAVREAVFQHYPCAKDMEESVWRRECVIAIDTGLRGENRTNLLKQRGNSMFSDQHQT